MLDDQHPKKWSLSSYRTYATDGKLSKGGLSRWHTL